MAASITCAGGTVEGVWIALAGFEVGEFVRVRVGRRKITVVPID